MFGLGGTSGGSLVKTMRNGRWGQDLNGAVVNSWTSWNAAVAQLRSTTGRDPRQENSWTNGPVWASVETTLATTDLSAPSESIDGNVNSTVASLASIGIVPLVVTQISCASFDFTVDSPAASAQAATAYWGERWCDAERACTAVRVSDWLFQGAVQAPVCAESMDVCARHPED